MDTGQLKEKDSRVTTVVPTEIFAAMWQEAQQKGVSVARIMRDALVANFDNIQLSPQGKRWLKDRLIHNSLVIQRNKELGNGRKKRDNRSV